MATPLATGMNTAGRLERGREAFRLKHWADAVADLAAADGDAPMAPPDYELLTVARYLLGAEPTGVEVWERAHHEFLARGDTRRAVRCAYWLAMGLSEAGEPARGAGWLARGNRLLDDADIDCVERGYLLVPSAIHAAVAGDLNTAVGIHDRVVRIAERFGDRDLLTLARHGRGRMHLQAGQIAAGLALFDEVMVAITSGEVSPIIVGVVYCSVIDALHQIFDVGRAQEWTAAMQRWCDDQTDPVLYRGRCLVYRSEVLQLRGEWPGALEESLQACRRFLGPPAHPAAGAALYQEAELHRLRGEFAMAEEAYARAGEFGRAPQPGLALLRLAQGRTATAEAAIRRVIGETRDATERARSLPAYVEIMLAVGDVPAAAEGAAELTRVAADLASDYLRGAAGLATGAARLGAGEAGAALGELREASGLWRQLGATHQAARTRMLIGLACRELGDEDGAMLELAGAREAFASLGAAPDLARLEEHTVPRRPRAAGLTGREVELLSLLATGKTNREIAAALVISEKTVARHISNIFNKLGVSSRAAATAYAFIHDLT